MPSVPILKSPPRPFIIALALAMPAAKSPRSMERRVITGGRYSPVATSGHALLGYEPVVPVNLVDCPGFDGVIGGRLKEGTAFLSHVCHAPPGPVFLPVHVAGRVVCRVLAAKL